MAKKTGRVSAAKRFTKAANKAVVEPRQAFAAYMEDLRQKMCSAMTLKPSPYVFDCDKPDDIDRLIDLIWSGEVCHLFGSLVEENPELAGIVHAATGNTYVPTQKRRPIYEFHRSNQLAGVFSQFYRMQSQKKTTILAVLLSLKGYKTKANGAFIEAIGCFFKGVTMSDDWTEKFVARAMTRRPPCPFSPVPDFGLTVYDNLQIRIGYKGFSTQDSAGVTSNYMLDMTNWIKFDIDARAAPQIVPGKIREIGDRSGHRTTPAGLTALCTPYPRRSAGLRTLHTPACTVSTPKAETFKVSITSVSSVSFASLLSAGPCCAVALHTCTMLLARPLLLCPPDPYHCVSHSLH